MHIKIILFEVKSFSFGKIKIKIVKQFRVEKIELNCIRLRLCLGEFELKIDRDRGAQKSALILYVQEVLTHFI